MRSLSGLSLLVSGRRWIELQSVSLPGSSHRELLIRQYERLGDEEATNLGYEPLPPEWVERAARGRAAAAAPLDVDDVLEALELVPAVVVEAAVLESDSTFALDAKTLIRMADAGVDETLIDLMVAVSYPDRFFVASNASSGGGGGGGGGYYGVPSLYIGSYASCWGPYYGPMYGPYGPVCDARLFSPYYGYYRPYRPYRDDPGGSGIGGIVGPGGSLYGGKVINKNGYARATPRPEPFETGVGGAVRRAFSRDGSSRNVFGESTSRSSGAGRSSVSPSGFSRSGSSGGNKSSGAKASARKAKPKGGGSS